MKVTPRRQFRPLAVVNAMSRIFTDEFRRADPVEAEPDNFCDRYIAMREAAEKRVGVTQWTEEKERADARLVEMGKSDNPEKVLEGVGIAVREMQTQARVETVIAQVLRGK